MLDYNDFRTLFREAEEEGNEAKNDLAQARLQLAREREERQRENQQARLQLAREREERARKREEQQRKSDNAVYYASLFALFGGVVVSVVAFIAIICF